MAKMAVKTWATILAKSGEAAPAGRPESRGNKTLIKMIMAWYAYQFDSPMTCFVKPRIVWTNRGFHQQPKTLASMLHLTIRSGDGSRSKNGCKSTNMPRKT